MTRKDWFLLLAGLVVGVIISGRYVLRAQDRPAVPPANLRPAPPENAGELPKETVDHDLPRERQPVPHSVREPATTLSLQEALVRPYHFPFARPTSLEQVCAHLRDTLKAAVVLDLAALDRKSVEPDAPVQLELDGVRLKTGLKLLLDQVGLNYHIIAEDNLMIITDQEGSEDPAERIWAELRALHRDLHAVQDAVDDLGDFLGVGGEGPRVRKPTIIEEMPANAEEKPGTGPERPGRAGEKPDGAGAKAARFAAHAVAGSAGGPAPQSLIGKRMRQGSTADEDGVATRRPRDGASGEIAAGRWLREPKTAVWFALAAVVLIGGGRKLSAWWQARKAVLRLGEANVTPEEMEAVAEHGRAGVYELLRIFSSSPAEPARLAAGRALARLWLLDQLVAEEEKAVVRRGYTVTWSARRRYPRALRSEIPITVSYDVPFLEDGGRRVGPANLEWSHRVLGARRAAMEEFSPWAAGPGRVAFTIFPGDFETNGPHRLVLQTKIRTAGLTDSWELEPPHEPFNFEFDPLLRLDAILTLPDAARDETVTRAIRLEPRVVGGGEAATYLSLGDEWTLRNPPWLAVALPLPCDLAHAISIEFEGIAERFSGGCLLVSGQGLPRQHSTTRDTVSRRFELGPVQPLPPGLIERPGLRRLRVWLEAALDRGWADPEIRSIWPGQTQTDWVEVEVVRR